jgi:hypothetical protein
MSQSTHGRCRLCRPSRPIRSLIAKDRSAGRVRDRTGSRCRAAFAACQRGDGNRGLASPTVTVKPTAPRCTRAILAGPCHDRATRSSHERSRAVSHRQHRSGLDQRILLPSQVRNPRNLALQQVVDQSRLASALPCPAGRSGPWSRRTGAPKASATRRDRNTQWSVLGPYDAGNPGFSAGTSGHDRSDEPAGRRTFTTTICAAGGVRRRVRTPLPNRCRGPRTVGDSRSAPDNTGKQTPSRPLRSASSRGFPHR